MPLFDLVLHQIVFVPGLTFWRGVILASLKMLILMIEVSVHFRFSVPFTLGKPLLNLLDHALEPLERLIETLCCVAISRLVHTSILFSLSAMLKVQSGARLCLTLSSHLDSFLILTRASRLTFVVVFFDLILASVVEVEPLLGL